MFKFAIEQGGPSTKLVEKTTFAEFYLQICVNGKPVTMPDVMVTATVDGCELKVGSMAAPSIGRTNAIMRRWGDFKVVTQEGSSYLMALKPHLPALCRLLASKFCKNEPSGLVDLYTGECIREPSPQIKYKFMDERVEMVEEPINNPSRILFKSLVTARDQVVQGNAGALTVELNMAENSTRGYANGCFRFKNFGWLSLGVAELRAKHDDATIKAAFQDLARKLLAQDATPTNAETWQASTKLELALE